MRVCRECGIKEGGEVKFNKARSICNACRLAYNRQWEASRKDWRRKTNKNNSDIKRQRISVFEQELGPCCYDCGTEDPAVLEWHHLRDKEANIFELKKRKVSLLRLFDEIKKCVRLCANCHRKRHSESRDGETVS